MRGEGVCVMVAHRFLAMSASMYLPALSHFFLCSSSSMRKSATAESSEGSTAAADVRAACIL